MDAGDGPPKRAPLPVDSMHSIEEMLQNSPLVRRKSSSVKIEKGVITENGPRMTSYQGEGHPPGDYTGAGASASASATSNSAKSDAKKKKKRPTGKYSSGSGLVMKIKSGMRSSKR